MRTASYSQIPLVSSRAFFCEHALEADWLPSPTGRDSCRLGFVRPAGHEDQEEQDEHLEQQADADYLLRVRHGQLAGALARVLPRRRAALLAPALLALAAAALALGARGPAGPKAARDGVLERAEKAADLLALGSMQSSCSVVEEDREYHTPRTVERLHGVETVELCCSHCEAHPDCGLWVWGKKRNESGLSDVCILKELREEDHLTKLKREGIVSGFVGSDRRTKHGYVAALLGTGRPRAPRESEVVIDPDKACQGNINVTGFGSMKVVSAEWAAPAEHGHRVDVEHNRSLRPRLNSRGYLVDSCPENGSAAGGRQLLQYTVLSLLGKTLKYKTDLSGAGCGCAGGLSLVPPLQSRLSTQCSDRRCDPEDGACLPRCPRITLQMANQYAWSSSLHVRGDTVGASTGFGGKTGHSGWSGEVYHPGSGCIDTSWPFEVAVSLPVNKEGGMAAMEVVLSQDGRECPLAGHVRWYDTPEGEDGMEELSRLLSEGMTPVIEYMGSDNVTWLDGTGRDGVGPCVKDVPEACASSVLLYDISIEDTGSSAPRKGPRQLGGHEDRGRLKNMMNSVMYKIHQRVATDNRALLVLQATEKSREEKDWKARITYRDLSSKLGTGTCADDKEEGFDCWWGMLPFAACEEQCSKVQVCLGFDFQFGLENCELRFSKGSLPANNPGPFNDSWSDGLGVGNITRVSDDGSDRRCYVKKLITTHQSSLTESFPSNPEWEVVYHGDDMKVRAKPSMKGKVLSTKPSGAIVVGGRLENKEGAWLKLAHEPGYMRMSLKAIGDMIRERRVTYAKVSGGACADMGLFPIIDVATCEAAAFALGYFDTKVDTYRGTETRPWGCHMKNGELYVAEQFGGEQADMPGTDALCASEDYVTTTTTTTSSSTSTTLTTSTSTRTTSTSTTSTSTSSTTTTWGWPSFFCYEVVRVGSYEVDMVKAHLEKRVSIFECEHYTVFSNGGVVDMGGGWNSTEIPAPEVSMGDLSAGATTNSWLNTMIFIKAWEMVKWDGRYDEHDWTIKVDPDAVFFPHRLRKRVAKHTHGKDHGERLFYMNCDLWNKVAMYGSLEIFSRQALNHYYNNARRCTNELHWQSWGEDFFMEKCMALLQVGYASDFHMIGDKRCHPAGCGDPNKVAFHDFKDVNNWFWCWEESTKAEGKPIPWKEVP